MNSHGLEMARNLAYVHAIRAIYADVEPLDAALLTKAASWNGSMGHARKILKEYQQANRPKRDRAVMHNIHLGRMEFWITPCFPGTAKNGPYWRWSLTWEQTRRKKVIAVPHMECSPGDERLVPSRWLVATLLNYQPILEQATPEWVTAKAGAILHIATMADGEAGLGGILIDRTRERIRAVAPDADLSIPVVVQERHVRALYKRVHEGALEESLVAGPYGDIAVRVPGEGDSPIWSGKELARFLRWDLEVPEPSKELVDNIRYGIQMMLDGKITVALQPDSQIRGVVTREQVSEIVRDYKAGGDMVLGRDEVGRTRIAPSSVAERRGWEILLLEELIKQTNIIDSENEIDESKISDAVLHANGRDLAIRNGESCYRFWSM